MVLVRQPSRQRLHDRIWGLGCTELAMIADALEASEAKSWPDGKATAPCNVFAGTECGTA
jgi:hypothetical protein